MLIEGLIFNKEMLLKLFEEMFGTKNFLTQQEGGHFEIKKYS